MPLRQTPQRVRFAILALLCLGFLPRAWADLDAARQDWASGEAQSAVIRLKTHLKSNPTDPQARLLLGQIYLEQGDANAAEQELMRAREAGADDAETRIGLMRALLGKQAYGRALEWHDAPADASPAQRAEILSLRGAARQAQGEHQAAAEAFAAAMEADPKSLGGRLGMASVALRKNDPDAARASIQRATHQHPESSDAWQALASLEALQEHPEAAIEALTKAIDLARVTWPLHYQRAGLYLDTGKTEQATADIEAVRARSPRTPALAYLDGRLALLDGENEDAAQHLEAYLRVAPGDQRGIYFAALALNRTGRHAQAEEYLLRLTAALPNNVAARTLLARTRLALDDAAGAEKAIAPVAFSDQATPLALETLRRALLQQRRTDEAAAVVERAAARFPELASAQLAYAAELQMTGDADAAVALLQRVIETDPENARALVLMIRARMTQGDLDAARRAATAMLDTHPELPLAHTAQGAVLVRQNDLDGARASFARALEIDPSFERAALALALIELGTAGEDRARETLDAVLAADPDNVAVTLARAALLRREQGIEAFDTELRRALARHPTALRLRAVLARSLLSQGQADAALALVQQAPVEQADADALLLLRARAQRMAGDQAASAATLMELAERNPTQARFPYMLASLAAEAGDLTAARTHLETGLELDPGDQLQTNRLARILAAVQSDQARGRMLKQLAQLAPVHPTLRLARAQYLAQQLDHTEAIAMLRALNREHPDNLEYVLALAQITTDARQPRQAESLLDEWLDDHPNSVPARLYRAQLHIAAGDYDPATAQYERILERHPDNPVALNNLAMLTLEQDPDRALDYAERALAQRPGDPAYIDTKGAVLLERGEFEAALPLLAKAHAESLDPGIAYRYAEALAGAGDAAGARRVLLTLQAKSFPEKDEADALLSRLAGGN